MPHTWKPNVTVAAVIERDGRFLLIEEETSDGVRLNQPAATSIRSSRCRKRSRAK